MAKKPSETKPAVVEPQQTALAGYDYSGFANAGFTDQHGEDLLIPFIDVLQPLSPQLETIEGAKPGMLFNSVTNELFTELRFVPAYRDWNFVEFIDREKGGGFVGIHAPDSDVVRQAKATAEGFDYTTGDGNQLVETFYLYSILMDEAGEEMGMAIIRFQSTKIRVYKGLMTQLRTLKVKLPNGTKVSPPLFAHQLILGTVKQENNKGKWYNFTIRPLNGEVGNSMLPPDSPLFQAGAQLYEMVTGGKAKPNYEGMDRPAGDDDTVGGKAPF